MCFLFNNRVLICAEVLRSASCQDVVLMKTQLVGYLLTNARGNKGTADVPLNCNSVCVLPAHSDGDGVAVRPSRV